MITCTNRYKYYEELILFPKLFHMKCWSTDVYNSVHFWFLQFPKHFLYLASDNYFQHYPWCLCYYEGVFISNWVHLFDIIFYCMPYVFIFCTNKVSCSIVVHIAWNTIQYILFTSRIYMRNVPEEKMLLINKLYNILIFSFPKQYYTTQLWYVIAWVHIKDIM